MITVEVYHQNTREMLMTFNLETTTRCMKVLGTGLPLDIPTKVTFDGVILVATMQSRQPPLCILQRRHPSYPSTMVYTESPKVQSGSRRSGERSLLHFLVQLIVKILGLWQCHCSQTLLHDA